MVVTVGAVITAVVAVGGTAVASATTAPAPDVSIVTAQTTNDDIVTSDPFSTSAGNELLVALFSADGPEDAYNQQTGHEYQPPGEPPQSVEAVTGCGLSWSPVAQANGMPGVAAVFTAFATTPLTGCQVTGQLLYDAEAMVSVVSFTGASPALQDPWEDSATTPAGFGVLNIAVDDSLVYQVGHNWSVAEQPLSVIGVVAGDLSGPPPQVGGSVVGTYLSDSGDTSYVSRLDDPVAATPPGTDRYTSIATWFSDYPYEINSVTFAVQPAG